MSKNTTLNLGTGGDTMTTVDLANFGSFGYPAGGDTPAPKLPCSVLYVSQAIGTVPTPVTTANPVPVAVQTGSTIGLAAGSASVGTVILGAGTAAVGTVTTNADAAVGAGSAPSKTLAVAGVFNTTPPAPTNTQTVGLQLDAAGSLFVTTEGRKSTFFASTGSFALAATPTDIAQLVGSGSRTIKVLRIKVQLLSANTTNQLFTVFAVKRSSAGSGFNSTATEVPANSAQAITTSGAAPQFTTANPTPGSAVGNVEVAFVPDYVTPPAATGNAASLLTYIFDFTATEGASPIILNGVAQTLAINLNGVTLSAATNAIVTFVYTAE